MISRRFRVLGLIVIALLVNGCYSPSSNSAEPTNSNTPVDDARSELERLAGELKFFPTGDFLYNRMTRDGRRKQSLPCYALLSRDLMDRNFDTSSLVKLLNHQDAKVRTLAMAALFDKEDPHVLPHLVKLADDKSSTFPAPRWPNAVRLEGPRVFEQPQTVSGICKTLVNAYLKPAGYHYFRDKLEFDDYWKSHKSRENCASWMQVKVNRAGGGTSPTPKHRVPALKRVREQIDAIAGMDAPLTLLWLAARRTEWDESGGADATLGARPLATREELIDACQQLGRERLMQILNRQPPTDDPDLQPRRTNNWMYKRMCLFILRNASELFEEEDSSALLHAEAGEQKYRENDIGDPTLTGLWATAAASLRPKDAHRVLHEAYSRLDREYQSDDRSELSIALWNHCGVKETKFLVNWFYTEQSDHGGFPHNLSYFLRQLRGTNDRSIYSALIREDRFNQLDWQSVETMAKVVNGWVDDPVVDPKDLQEAWHPLGQSRYHWNRDKARDEYPKETAKLEAELARWRAELRKSVSTWE